MRTSVPCPGRLLTVMVPPSPSMMRREIASPRPVPVRRVVKNGSKTRAKSSASIPAKPQVIDELAQQCDLVITGSGD